MTILLLTAPTFLSSKESQSNDIVIDKVTKLAVDRLVVLLFGSPENIQKYIPSVYTTLWDYCLLYNKHSLDCIVIPQTNTLSPFLLEECKEDVYIPNSFSDQFINQINEKRNTIGMTPLSFKTMDSIDWDETIVPLDWENAKTIHLSNVCVGGTFDRLHPGHRILLTLASLVCDNLVIGLTTDIMLQKKEKHEMIKSFDDRKSTLLSFLSTIAPSLHVDISPLHDICGPAAEREELEGIVVSIETLAGARLINQKHMKPLTIMTVNRASKYNLSSTFIRDYF